MTPPDWTDPLHVAGALLVVQLAAAVLCVNLVPEDLLDQQALSGWVLALMGSACLTVRT